MICAAAAMPFQTCADEVAYRYEGDVYPYPDAGWLWGGCDGPCSESLIDGYFRLDWDVLSSHTNYHHWIAQVGQTPPSPPFWVEWRFRSDQRLFDSPLCDGRFVVNYQDVHEVWYMFGDAIISNSWDDVRLFPKVSFFRTFRFESLDGVNFCLWTDGDLFNCGTDHKPTGSHYIQMHGEGACSLDVLPTVNEWDFVRYGTIAYGEQIISSDPPQGFVDARVRPMLDRFTVTYESPNYVYIEEIATTTTVGIAPSVVATRRLDNGPPETVEIVLDQPIPYNAATRFTFNDGVAVQTIEFTYAPGDTDGDGDADLADFAAFQNCLGNSPVAGVCLPLDFNADSAVDLLDFAEWQRLTIVP